MSDYKSLAIETVDKLLKHGAEACDVYISTSSSSSINMRMGKIEKVSQSISKGLGLRVFKNNATAITYTTDFTHQSLNSSIKDVMEIVNISSPDKYNGLAPKELLGIYKGELNIFDESIAKLTQEQKIAMVLEAEQIGLNYDKRITNCQGATWGDDSTELTLATSDGFIGQYKTSAATISVSLLAEENGVKQRDFYYSSNRLMSRLLSPKEIGQETARRTLRKLGGKKIKSQVVPVVVDPFISRRFVSMLFNATIGRNIYNRASYLVNKLDQQVISPLITIIDDATIADGIASRPFDAEGIESSKLVIIDQGVLKNYVCDSYSARCLGKIPTSNATRTFQSMPHVSSSNLYMKAGQHNPTDIIKSVEKGFYLTELVSQGYNPVTGNLSQGAGGFWIENGEITYPVQEITIAGNLLTMFNKISMIGNDLSFKFGTTAAPTILISEATIAGT